MTSTSKDVIALLKDLVQRQDELITGKDKHWASLIEAKERHFATLIEDKEKHFATLIEEKEKRINSILTSIDFQTSANRATELVLSSNMFIEAINQHDTILEDLQQARAELVISSGAIRDLKKEKENLETQLSECESSQDKGLIKKLNGQIKMLQDIINEKDKASKTYKQRVAQDRAKMNQKMMAQESALAALRRDLTALSS